MVQSGLMGVFLAKDALCVLFWELALDTCTFFAVNGRRASNLVTFKFSSTLSPGHCLCSSASYMYISIPGPVYLGMVQHPLIPLPLNHFYHASPDGYRTKLVILVILIAFAIKMPIFHFHTWQPDTYDRSPTQVTMVLIGIMVKMIGRCILADPFS